MAKIFLAIMLCLVLIAPARAESRFAQEVAGDWRGVGVQEGSENWLVLLRIESGHASVDFPEFPCGGQWEYGSERAASLTSIEHLDYGQALCLDKSRVVLERASPTQLYASWYNAQGDEIGFAVLHRNDPALNNRENERAESALTRMTRNLGLDANPACLPPLV